MVQLRLILRLFILASLQTAECSYDRPGAMSLSRKISKASERASSSDYVPYRGNIPNLFLSASFIDLLEISSEKCEPKAVSEDNDFWAEPFCTVGKLSAPVCRVDNANESGFMIKASFLTDGSPDDDPFPSNYAMGRFSKNKPYVAFRVMTPTIPEFPEFTPETAFPIQSWRSNFYSPPRGKILVFTKLGELVATDDRILVDPSCHTNNTCGVAFLTTSVAAVNTPHVALDQHCGQTIDLNDTPVLNVFSHAGIGCKLFPDVYSTPNCELTITSPSAFTANVTLVNFRKTTCGGYELKFVTSTCTVDVCQENSPTVFDSSNGQMQIKLTGRASENWPRYGFIIRLEKVTQMNKLSQCSSINAVQGATDDSQVSTTAPAESPTNSPVQGATDDIPQVSTTGPAESPTNSPVQNPTDGTDVDLPEASLESSSATEFISDPTGSFESESPSVSPKSPTNSHHLHLMLALGIEL